MDHLKHYIWLLTFALFGAAANGSVKFEPIEPPFISTDSQIPAIAFNKIHQDQLGFLWFASNKGVFRFDGQQVTPFNVKNLQLSNDVLVDIAETDDGSLMFASYGGGLLRYDHQTERFSRFEPIQGQSLSSDTLWAIASSHDAKQLWLGSRKWLDLVDPGKQTLSHFNPNTSPALDSNNNIWQILASEPDKLWLATLGGGVYQFNPINGELTQYSSQSNHAGLSNDLVRSIATDKQGNLWIGTDNGLNMLSVDRQHVTQYFHQPNNQFSLSSNEINKVYVDKQNRIWVGTYGQGLNLYDRKNQRFLRYRFSSIGRSQALTPTIVNDIFEDRENILWVATDKGIIKLLPQALEISHLGLLDETQKHVFDNDTTALLHGSRGDIWSAIAQTLIRFDSASMRVSQMLALPGKVISMTKNQQGDILLAIYGKGLFKLARSAQEVTPITLMNNISAVHVDARQRLWIGNFRADDKAGLLLYDLKTNTFERFKPQDNIVDIQSLNDTTLVLATANRGVLLLDLNTLAFTRIENEQSQGLNNLVAMHLGKDNKVWLATESSGLAELLVAESQIKSVAPELGVIKWIRQTETNALWLATENQLLHYPLDDRPPSTFGAKESLVLSTFHQHAVLIEDNNLLFGTDNGLMRFPLTQQLMPMRQTYPINLTELRVFNQPIKPDNTREDSLLKLALNNTKHLQLPYHNYLFSIGFMAPNFQYPEGQHYLYRLEGYDDRWIAADNQRPVATFSSVPPGDYQFKVKALNRNNQEVSAEKVLSVTIEPPWWQTAWAYLAYVTGAIMLIMLIVQLRTRQMKLKAIALEQGIAQRTEALERQKQTIELLLGQKQRLFTNISHELRTPLTLLLSPVEQLFKNLPAKTELATLQMIKRNAQRMQHLLDQLLQLAELDGKTPAKVQLISLDQGLEQIVQALKPLAEKKQQQLQLHCPQTGYLKMQQDAFEQIVVNLLLNAIKYTPEQGEIAVLAEVSDTDAIIIVKDSGLGIAPDHQQMIFERFERGAFSHNETIAGSGIGLALVKERVAQHQGQITVESTLGLGSRFKVTLPLYQLQPSDKPCNALQLNIDEQQQYIGPEPVAPQNPEELPDDQPILLLIEDNADMRSHLSAILKIQYFCIIADNGLDALTLAKRFVPDIIVCDVMLPGMSGFEICNELKQTPALSHIPVLLLTALADKQNRLQGWQNHADEYLTKPFDDDELLLRLDNLTTIRGILRQRYAAEFRLDPQRLEQTKVQLNEKDRQFVEQFEALMAQHYDQEQFQLPDAAKALAMSDRQLQRKLKAIMDMNFSQYLRRFRLAKAQALLEQGQAITVVTEAVGFSSASYFATCFKAEFDQTPKQYQQQFVSKNRQTYQ